MDNKVLGKGLSALIPGGIAAGVVSKDTVSDSSKGVAYVNTDLVKDNRLQPRENYAQEKLEELMASIKEKGVLQPILVRRNGDGYEVVAGERRLRAARALKLSQIPVIIKDVTDRESLVLALVENMQREGLNPVEEAKGFKRLIDDFGFTQDGVAQAVGKDRSTITNLMRLLRLPKTVQALIIDGQISAGHAKALLSFEDARLQEQLAQDIVKKSLSVRQIEAMAKKRFEEGAKIGAKPIQKIRDIEILEEELSRKLGTKVIVDDKKGKGKLVIEYYSLTDLDRILGVLRQ